MTTATVAYPRPGFGMRSVGAFLSVLALLTGLSCSGRGDGEDTERVVLYCSVDQAIAEPIITAFEKQTGIRVATRFDTEASKTVGLVQKLRAEKAFPAADVFWSSEVFYTIRLAREGLLAPYDGKEVRSWPTQFADPQRRWYAFALRGRVIGYNTKRLSPADAPKTLEDLLQPKWTGRIVMARPQFGTTGGDVASWFAHYGHDRARAILRGLRDNDVRLVDGNSTAVRAIATGQADVCLTDTDDVYAGRRNGWPVAMHALDQNGAGALAIPNTAALVKGGPHPKAAARLMAFLLGEQVERMLAASDSHNTPIRPAVAAEFPTYRVAKPLAVEYDKVADQLPTALRAAREILP